MNEFLADHGYLLLFGTVLVEQMGLPIPAAPFLLAAGALAGMHRLSLTACLLLAIAAALGADVAWYALGRRKGGAVLAFLCRMSLEPESCIRKTEDTFVRHGARALLVAKFVPGLNAVAAPLSGMTGLPLSRFLAWDGAGALLWAGCYLALGHVFHDQLEGVAAWLTRLGGGLAEAAVMLLAVYLGVRFLHRRLFIRKLRVARITPQELKKRLDAGEGVSIVDLRHERDFAADPVTVPGALHIATRELDARHAEIPRDREVVLYCT